MSVFFDLDGTLCYVDSGRRCLLDECLGSFGVDGVGREDYIRTHQRVLEEGKVKTREPVFRKLLRDVGVSDESLVKEVASSYREMVLDNLALYEDARVIESIDDDLVLITNGPEVTQWEKVRKLGLDDVFDEVVISGEVGFAKPDPLIFKVAYARVGEKGPYVGNSVRHDVRGAVDAGFRSVLVDRGVGGCDEADFVVESLLELKDILDI